jgi:hypothetical protein
LISTRTKGEVSANAGSRFRISRFSRYPKFTRWHIRSSCCRAGERSENRRGLTATRPPSDRVGARVTHGVTRFGSSGAFGVCGAS